jgi:hypothetical protein
VHREQVGDELAHQLMTAHLFRRDLFGLAQRGESLTDLAALCVRTCCRASGSLT